MSLYCLIIFLLMKLRGGFIENGFFALWSVFSIGDALWFMAFQMYLRMRRKDEEEYNRKMKEEAQEWNGRANK